MRILVIALLLSIPSMAFADPCAKGTNVPINSNTAAQSQPTTTSTASSHTSFGTHTAQKTAYPH